MSHPRCLRIPPYLKEELRVLFLAKHALSDGSPHPEDGTHATYHRELLDTLRAIGLNVVAANSFAALYERPDVDFVVTLLNRAGFRNSEMLAPLLGEMHGLPYLGGAPFVRGLADDKHFMKRIARGLGVRTPDWRYFPRCAGALSPPQFAWDALIVKPNASSASWGIEIFGTWSAAVRHVHALHEQGHDVIVENYIEGADLAAPVIGAVTPWYLPIVEYRGDSGPVRTYAQKRDLVPSHTEHALVEDAALVRAVTDACEPLVAELWPFDHGRLEFRVERATGTLYFIEININCNLWSRKTIATVARRIGVSHGELIETILAHSLARQRVGPHRTGLAA